MKANNRDDNPEWRSDMTESTAIEPQDIRVGDLVQVLIIGTVTQVSPDRIAFTSEDKTFSTTSVHGPDRKYRLVSRLDDVDLRSVCLTHPHYRVGSVNECDRCSVPWPCDAVRVYELMQVALDRLDLARET